MKIEKKINWDYLTDTTAWKLCDVPKNFMPIPYYPKHIAKILAKIRVVKSKTGYDLIIPVIMRKKDWRFIVASNKKRRK